MLKGLKQFSGDRTVFSRVAINAMAFRNVHRKVTHFLLYTFVNMNRLFCVLCESQSNKLRPLFI